MRPEALAAGPAGAPLRAWALDGAACGAIGVGSAMSTIAIALSVADGPPGRPLEVLLDIAVGTAVGGAAGAVAGLPAGGLARALWPVSRGAAFLVGPVLAPAAALAITEALLTWLDGHPNWTWRVLAMPLALGTLGVGPPWVAVLALRARGRPTWPAAVGASGWAAALALALLAYVRVSVGLLPP